jgi:hypothetical protein
VTPKILFDFFQKGKWDLEYPEHSIPKKRYDILINQIVLFIISYLVNLVFDKEILLLGKLF